MKKIETLVTDIYDLVKTRGWFVEELATEFGVDVSKRLQEKFNRPEGKGTLRLSRMGQQCPRALWYALHHPELATPIPGPAEIKYTYGHIVEALVIALAKGAGHEVVGEQDELTLDNIVGHRDCVIDGYTVDVKSANSRMFLKLKTGTMDAFTSGYFDQLVSYTIAARGDPLVKYTDACFILGADQERGQLCLRKHEVTDEHEAVLRERITYHKLVSGLSRPPACECKSVAQGSSGNLQLDTKASYSPYKYCCNPSLRTFLYSAGPVFLTRVLRKPDVPEVDAGGKLVYH